MVIDHLRPEQWADAELSGWPYRRDRPFAQVAGWVNMELMKNMGRGT